MKTFVVERYLSPKSYQVAIRDFEPKFNNGKAPLKFHIVEWVKKFRGEGTVRDLRGKTPGRSSHSGPKKVTWHHIEAIRKSVGRSPKSQPVVALRN